MTASPCSNCAGSTRASAPSRSCTTSTSQVYPGQVTALVGDNGAGKSTLVKCIAGIYPIDTGDFLFDGKPVHVHSPRTPPRSASRSSTRTSRCATTSTSSRTCSSAASGTAACVLDEADDGGAGPRHPRLAVGAHREVGPPAVASLSGGQRQTVAIAKAVLWNSKVVMLDEPTAALGVAQTRQVLDLVRRLADNGLGVVLISHNMIDVFEVADRITALYLGRVAADVPTARRQPQPDRRADHRRPLGRPRHLRTPPIVDREERSMTSATPAARADRRHGRRRAPQPPTSPPTAPSASVRERCRPTSTGCAAVTWARCPPCSASSCSASSSRSCGRTPSRPRSTSPTCSPRPSPIFVLAMGLVFVLLLGEIDLSAGVTGGVCAAVIGRRCSPSTASRWYLAVLVGARSSARSSASSSACWSPSSASRPSSSPWRSSWPPGRHAEADRRRAAPSPSATTVIVGIDQQQHAGRAGLGPRRRSSSCCTRLLQLTAARTQRGAPSLACASRSAIVLARIVGSSRVITARRDRRAQPEPRREPALRRSRASRTRARWSSALLLLLDVRARPHRVRPARLRGRRQRRGRPPRRHQRRPDQGARRSSSARRWPRSAASSRRPG